MTQDFSDQVEVHRISGELTGYRVIPVEDDLPTGRYAFLSVEQSRCELEGELPVEDDEFVVYVGEKLDGAIESKHDADQVSGIVLRVLDRCGVSVLGGVTGPGATDSTVQITDSNQPTTDVRGSTPLQCPDVGCRFRSTADPWTDRSNVDVMDVIPQESGSHHVSSGGANRPDDDPDGTSIRL